MKLLLSLIAVASILAARTAKAGDELNAELTKQISVILAESRKVVPGVTRAELMKVFTTEGGISTATHRTFVHRRCPYIKVEVDFTLSEPTQGVVDERPTDTITKISRPFLEMMIAD